MKKVIKEILFWTWCLPQTLIGFILYVIFEGKIKHLTTQKKQYQYYIYKLKNGSISLGKYILLTKYRENDVETIKHEYGHQIQSYILGPLYLLLIGLPSLLWACIFWNPNKHSYYWFYTEKWANKLGGVELE